MSRSASAHHRGLPGVVLGAVLSAVLWTLLYEAGAATTGLLALGHALAALVLGGLWWRLGTGSSSDGVLFALGLLVALPAAGEAGAPAIAGLPRVAQLGALAGAGAAAVALALGLLRLRLGRVVVVLGTAAALLGPLLPREGGGALRHAELVSAEATGRVFRRVAILGVDGADWRVLDPMMRAGELPTLAGLVRRGAHAVLHSTDPSYSPVVWTSIFTGMTPERHGISGWERALSHNRRVPTLWELTGALGLATAVANVPGTWPPREFDGALVSGFPMPRLTVSTEAAGGQFLGRILAPSPREGLVPTTVGAGGKVDVPLGRWQVLARSPVRHVLLEAAIRNRWLRGGLGELTVETGRAFAEPGDLDLRVDEQRLSLARGEWSDWLEIEAYGRPAVIRMRRLASGALYVTPPFQTVREPRFPVATGAVALEELVDDTPYVVEGVGWKAAADPDMRLPVYEHLLQVERIHSEAARRLARDRPEVFAYVHTLTDRVQHAFWPYHDPDAFGSLPEAEIREHGQRVRDAYRAVDRELAGILEALGEDVTVFIVSDHGVAPDPESGFGGHRPEGVLIAAGPGVQARAERLDLSIYEVAPTVLAGLGLPVARDLVEEPRVELLRTRLPVRFVDTFGSDAAAAVERIDRSTAEQLRALGYVD